MDAHAERHAAEQRAGGASPAVRLLTLATLFPNSRQPRHGIFVANRLRKLCDTGRVEATVVAAVPSFPGAYRSCAEVPAVETVDGFDVRYGLTTPNLLEARVNRAMAEAARRTIVVCDSSKFGRRSLSLIMPTSTVHETITDRKIAKFHLKSLRKADVEVTLV